MSAQQVGPVAGLAMEALERRLQQSAAQLRVLLQEERDALDGDAATLPKGREDSGDEASVDVMRDIEVDAVSRHAADLEAVEVALDRVHAGSYGLCINCGEEIAAERLDAQPAVARCLACQVRAEHGSGSGAGRTSGTPRTLL